MFIFPAEMTTPVRVELASFWVTADMTDILAVLSVICGGETEGRLFGGGAGGSTGRFRAGWKIERRVQNERMSGPIRCD